MLAFPHFETQLHLRRRDAGMTTFLALFMLALLGFIGATVLLNVGRLYNGNEKVQGWQEALFAAEAGSDVALANLRRTISGSPTPFDAADGWTTTTSANNTVYTYTTPTTNQAGEGTYQTWAVVTVDSPIGSNATNPPTGLTDARGNQWYRIRSTGHARLPGLARVSPDILGDLKGRHNNALRKFNLKYDHLTGASLSVPEATRTVEVIVQPKTGFLPALLADSKLHLHDNNSVDSFDSTDPTKSSTIGGFAGQYDPAKFQKNGDIGSNGSNDDAIKIDGTHTQVYGDAGTNGGSFTNADGEIQSPGQINNSVSTKINPVPIPKWGLSGYPSINPAITTVTTNKTLTVSADPSQNYYKINKIEDKKLDIVLPTGVTSGTVNIWITDKMKGEIHIPVGVTLNVYFSGKTFRPKDDAGKNGFDNDNLNAKYLNIYGVDPVKGNIKMDFNIHDTSLYASVYAPSANLKLKSDLKTGVAFIGSFVGDEIDANGVFHYDEALNGIGEVIDYAKASYVEDPR